MDIMKLLLSFIGVVPSQNHDLADLKAGKTATDWYSRQVCPNCHSATGHREFMTEICMTCGQKMKHLPRDEAFRHVTRHGRWVIQQNATRPLLRVEQGVWLSPEEYDKRVLIESNYLPEVK